MQKPETPSNVSRTPIRSLSGREIAERLYGDDVDVASLFESLKSMMPNGKPIGDCTVDEIDRFGDFFMGQALVETLDAEDLIVPAWLISFIGYRDI